MPVLCLPLPFLCFTYFLPGVWRGRFLFSPLFNTVPSWDVFWTQQLWFKLEVLLGQGKLWWILNAVFVKMCPMHCRSFEHLETAAASHKKRRRREGGGICNKKYDSACVAQHNCHSQNEGSDVKLGTGVGITSPSVRRLVICFCTGSPDFPSETIHLAYFSVSHKMR